jgi:hypothetical protein
MELLVGLALSAVGGLLILGILVSSNNIFVTQSVQVNQGLSLNQSSYEITELIKSSAGVVSQYPETGAPQFVTSSQILVLKLPAFSANGQIIDSVFDFAVIARDPSSSKILRKYIFADGASSRKPENKVLSTTLNDLEFLYLDSGGNYVSSGQATRINYTINQLESAGFSPQESSSSGIVNIKNKE